MVIHKSFADFVLFLYVHMASADGEFHSLEEGVILEKMAKIFPEESDPKKRFKEAVSQYKSIDRSKMTSIISDTFKHFDQVKFAQKYKVYTDMYDIINADGKVHESETKAMHELKQIIELGAEKKHSETSN
jgi:uncharacterized tellurite resistance protein B-like protein